MVSPQHGFHYTLAHFCAISSTLLTERQFRAVTGNTQGFLHPSSQFRASDAVRCVYIKHFVNQRKMLIVELQHCQFFKTRI